MPMTVLDMIFYRNVEDPITLISLPGGWIRRRSGVLAGGHHRQLVWGRAWGRVAIFGVEYALKGHGGRCSAVLNVNLLNLVTPKFILPCRGPAVTASGL